jgi:hypothetical protein
LETHYYLIPIKKILQVVATILTATTKSPNISVTVAPNPEINNESPQQQRGRGNENQNNIQQATITDTNNNINNNSNAVDTNNHHTNIVNLNHAVQQENVEPIAHRSPSTRKYLISQFFQPLNDTRTRAANPAITRTTIGHTISDRIPVPSIGTSNHHAHIVCNNNPINIQQPAIPTIADTPTKFFEKEKTLYPAT